jgi:histidinol phosphatase-like enzyme/predicted kinase
LIDLSPMIVPLPGVTRVETAVSAAKAQRLVLTDEDRRVLDDRFPAGRVLRQGPARATPAPQRGDAEVVIVMGLPAAGKTRLAAGFVAGGYLRVNRDEQGGALRDLLPAVGRALDAGTSRIVLDNTYISRQSRAEVIRAASERGVPTRCVWLSTSVDEAQVNAASRLVARYGRLPDDDDLRVLRKQDPGAFLPGVQFRYQRELEPPDPSEGFSRIDVVPFERQVDPSWVNRAVIVWCDEVLLRSRSGQRTPADRDDMAVVEHRAATLARYRDEGWRVLGLSWQPEIAGGTRTHADARAVFARMQEVLHLAIDVEYCPHAAGPPACWCRKPLPGLGVLLIHRHQLDPGRCIFVGAGPQDPGFARKLGFAYQHADDFF